MKKYRIKSREEMIELHGEEVITVWDKDAQDMLGTIQEGEKYNHEGVGIRGRYWFDEDVEEIEEEVVDFSVSSIKDDSSFSLRIQGSTTDTGILTANKDDLLKVSGTKEYKLNVNDTTEYTDKHYDFYYSLTEEEIKSGKIKMDPYKVAKCIKLGSKDESCALFHIFKTIFRWGEKNPIEREVKAVEGSIKRYKEENNIK